MTVVATAGHVDHGKSSLVRALTGTDPDRLEEEKRRGLTIDLGFAHTTLPSGTQLSFVDVPGHVQFLRNMLAGVGGVERVRVRRGGDRGMEAAVGGASAHPRTARDRVGTRRPHQDRPRRRRISQSWRQWTSPTTWPAPSSSRRPSLPSRRRPVPASTTLRGALDRLVERRRGGRPGATATLDRPGLRRQGQWHGGDRNPRGWSAHRRPAGGGRTGRTAGEDSGHPDRRSVRRRHRAGQPRRREPRGCRPPRRRPRSRGRRAGSVAAHRSLRRVARTCSTHSTTTCRVGAPTSPTSGPASIPRPCASSAPTPSRPAPTAPCDCSSIRRCRCCRVTGSSCGSRAATRRSAVGRSSTSPPCSGHRRRLRIGRSNGSCASAAG